MLDLAGGIAGQRDDDETGQSAPGLPGGNEDLEKSGIHIGSLGDAGEMLDDQAKAAYRRRLSDLREELEEAKELGNVQRAEQAEQEIDALTKNSRAPSDSEAGIVRRPLLPNAPGRASARRSKRYWKESLRAMLRLRISSRDASRPAHSVPISLTPISRLRGNSVNRLSNQTSRRFKGVHAGAY